MNRVISALGILAVGVAAYFISKDRKPDSTIPGVSSGEAPEVLPASPADNAPLSTEAGPGADLIKSRMKELFSFSGSRQSVLENYGILDGLFSGVEYRSGVNTVLNLLFGNVFNVPIYPKSFYPAYAAQLETIVNTQGFEEITKNSGGNTDTAFSIWRNVLQLPDGQTLWFSNVDELIRAGIFGTPGPADKNLSERYDAYTRDMQTLSKNLLVSSRKIEDALRQQAISDLKASGYKFTGV